jgi:hypothetical protein
MRTRRETRAVVHQPRVARDGARAFVRAAGSVHGESFADRVLHHLGPGMYGDYADTRHRLLTAYVETGGDRHAADVEAGRWRVRLEELLRDRPELTAVVQSLTSAAFEL